MHGPPILSLTSVKPTGQNGAITFPLPPANLVYALGWMVPFLVLTPLSPLMPITYGIKMMMHSSHSCSITSLPLMPSALRPVPMLMIFSLAYELFMKTKAYMLKSVSSQRPCNSIFDMTHPYKTLPLRLSPSIVISQPWENSQKMISSPRFFYTQCLMNLSTSSKLSRT